MKKREEIASFDFSTIGEEEQIIIENHKHEEPQVENTQSVEKKQEDLFTSKIREEFQKQEENVLVKTENNISVKEYFKMSKENLETVEKLHKRVLSEKNHKQAYEVLKIEIKWIKSIKGYIDMAGILNSSKEINFSGIIQSLENTISELKELESKLEK